MIDDFCNISIGEGSKYLKMEHYHFALSYKLNILLLVLAPILH